MEGRTQEVGIGLPFGPFLRLEWLKSWLANCALKFRPLSLSVGWVWWFAGAFFILYLLIAVLFPHPVECCLNQITARPATTFAVGILAKVMMPFVLLLLVFTVIGVFVVPFIVVGALLSLLVGKVALTEFIGGRIGAPLGLKGGKAAGCVLCRSRLHYAAVFSAGPGIANGDCFEPVGIRSGGDRHLDRPAA